MTRATSSTQREALAAQVAMIGGLSPSGFIEVRYKRPSGGMGQMWLDADNWAGGVGTILGLGERTDTYLGGAPRTERHGGKSAVRQSHCLWVDCDDAAAAERLRAFAPAPTMILRSGRDDGVHAWWALSGAVEAPEALEQALRRLAHHLGADMACCDAGRIMRAAGTLNHKYDTPRPVVVERLEPVYFTVRELVGHLPEPQAQPTRERGTVIATDDVLASIPPRVYVEALTGRVPDRSGKVACPFHEDRTPSLHAYETAGEGWCCFGGCGAGTIIDFGARLYGIEPRGGGYHDIRRRLARDLLASIGSEGSVA